MKKSGFLEFYAMAASRLVYGKEAANEINIYICKICTELDAKLPTPSDTQIYPLETPHTYLEDLEQIEVDDLIKEIKRIDITKSSGFIKISTKVFKTIFLLTPECLLHILNRCIITNTFPTCWKTSLKTSIPKKGDTQQLKNIRPISILPLPGKLLERFINNYLTDYLENNGLLCKE